MNFHINYSEDLPSHVRDALPPYDLSLRIRNEVDFYGAGLVVAHSLDMGNNPIAYSSWSHGWGSAGLKFPEQILWNRGWMLNRLVRTRAVEEFLRSHGVKNVRAVGLPIVYVNSGGIQRLPGSVLFMPAHSLSYVNIDQNVSQMIADAKSMKAAGNYVCFCVHSDCIRHGKIIPELNKHQIDWFVGASVVDVNALQRMRNIFELFEYVASNVIGSHFVYSQLFGAKYFFIEPYFEYKSQQFSKDPFLGSRPELTKYLIEQSSPRVIKQKYKKYFRGFENAVCDQKFAESECGVPDKVDAVELGKLLGWDRKTQIMGRAFSLVDGARNKINKLKV